jgi:Ni,Fe-hydrogenase III large subunit
MKTSWKIVRNAVPVSLDEIPATDPETFRQSLASRVKGGAFLHALFGTPPTVEPGQQLFAVVGHPRTGDLEILSTRVPERYPAITPLCPAAHWFEREIAEQWGVVPEGHPWLKPIRFHPSRVPERDAWNRLPGQPILPCVTDFFRIEGDQIHEVAVGPVHAGVIEPGHFRFQCHGEEVFHLEISLGYQHRGIERALVGGPTPRTLPFMETLAGDTTVGHSLAYAHLIEGLTEGFPSVRAGVIRGIGLELERLANHTGDLGALANDVGFLPTASFCGRLRGDFLNMSALLSGSRFSRGLVLPGGVGFDLEPERIKTLLQRLQETAADVENAALLLWVSSSVMARFEHTGRISAEIAREIGLVGPAGRASGVDYDVRRDYPLGVYADRRIPTVVRNSGDVFARAYIRWQEIGHSVAFIQSLSQDIPPGPISRPVQALPENRLAISLTEGWRGEICHIAATDPHGRFAWYKIVDPSFHNWFGLALALRGQQISDFPLCNKSFNLSYCGHDL